MNAAETLQTMIRMAEHNREEAVAARKRLADRLAEDEYTSDAAEAVAECGQDVSRTEGRWRAWRLVVNTAPMRPSDEPAASILGRIADAATFRMARIASRLAGVTREPLAHAATTGALHHELQELHEILNAARKAAPEGL